MKIENYYIILDKRLYYEEKCQSENDETTKSLRSSSVPHTFFFVFLLYLNRIESLKKKKKS